MKKFLSLMMVVAMLFAVLAFVGCDNTDDDTTTAPQGNSTTTSSSEEATSSSEESTSSSEENTTSSSEENTTSSSEESTTSSEETTTSSEETTTTLPPVFSRFDFGTDSKAQELGLTSHQWLVEALSYDAKFISVDYTPDSIIVTALQDHPEIKFELDEDGDRVEVIGKDAEGNALYSSTSYALCFEDFDLYTFDQHLMNSDKFMKIRLINKSDNNIIAVQFHDTARGYALNMYASNMYLQGGAPDVDDLLAGEHRLTADPVDVYKSYTYDMTVLSALCRSSMRSDGLDITQSYVHYMYYVGTGGSTGSNNWAWMGANECNALRFYVLGSYGNRAYLDFYNYADTRANITKDDQVEIDYILFAPNKADFNTFVSNIESSSISESISVSASIAESESLSASIAESEAALTATTAASESAAA